ncbi:MAG TPA: VWA domain-containing protein [Pirellulales bacterium]|jgi:Ca-activated chloride channel family protein|nr:VWA domain-containing protein [Pirellulales bacterium]
MNDEQDPTGADVERNSFRLRAQPADPQRNEAVNDGPAPLTADDPRLTAYVLGELEGAELALVERELACSESCRRTVDEIRQSTGLLVAALATEPVVTLATAQRNQVERGIKHVAREDFGLTLMMTMAGSLLVVVGIGATLLCVSDRREEPPKVAVAHRASTLATPEYDQLGERRDGHPIASEFRVEEIGGGTSDGAMGGQSYQANLGPVAGFSPFTGATGVGGKPYDQVRRPRGGMGVDLFDASRTPNESMPTPFGESRGPGGVNDGFDTEAYDRIYENPFLEVRQNPLSTFSIDVDTASYANVRRFLNQHALPPKDAVRIEELVNYFSYHYAAPQGDAPFAVHTQIAGCPWRPEHRLLRIAIKGREIDLANRPASNLVFLIDVSGSMDQPDKLPLLKSAMAMLVDQLGENDRVAMVVYAGSSGLVLPSTSGERKAEIRLALEQLQAGGSTNGAAGIELAYQVARQNFIRGGTNRVLLCTDGDFNVGVTDSGSLTRLIEEQATSGVFLSVMGFGTGNLKDATMEKLADRGNGNYAYIDGPSEARKVLVEQLGGTLVTIAKDVKLQIEFNPTRVAAYRLLGYENRLLRTEDFNDDRKDAGEIGAGHTVTAFYELVPPGGDAATQPATALKYQRVVEPTDAAAGGESLTLGLRYKPPEANESLQLSTVVKDGGHSYAEADRDFKFAAAVAAFGLVLRDSEFKGSATLAGVLELAEEGRGADEGGYRAEFIELVKKAREIAGK